MACAGKAIVSPKISGGGLSSGFYMYEIGGFLILVCLSKQYVEGSREGKNLLFREMAPVFVFFTEWLCILRKKFS